MKYLEPVAEAPAIIDAQKLKEMFDYNAQLSMLWQNLRIKLTEKMSDSRKIMTDELRLLQGRHRQFYKIQLNKQRLDKFEPAKEIKLDQQLAIEKEKASKLKKKVLSTEDAIVVRSLLNFSVTLLMYEDINS